MLIISLVQFKSVYVVQGVEVYTTQGVATWFRLAKVVAGKLASISTPEKKICSINNSGVIDWSDTLHVKFTANFHDAFCEPILRQAH